jgi:hypothetical protein
LVAELAEISAVTPYSRAEVRKSAAQLGIDCGKPTQMGTNFVPPDGIHASASHVTEERPIAVRAADVDALEVLAGWRRAQRANYSLDARNPDALLGRGIDVRGGAAAAVLAFLEHCAQFSKLNGKFSTTRTWNFFEGVEKTTAADARTRVAALFEIDEEASLDGLRRSDALLWLALDLKSRSKGVHQQMVGQLEREPEHASRINRIRAAAEERDKE